MEFLGEVDDCFGRSEPREHLRTYVSGQLSDLPRKSIEPIALASGTPPRTLQRFFECRSAGTNFVCVTACSGWWHAMYCSPMR